MLSSYYKRLITPSSFKICLNFLRYSGSVKSTTVAADPVNPKKRRKKEEIEDEKVVIPPEFVDYFGNKRIPLLNLFPKRLFKKTTKTPEIYYLLGNGKDFVLIRKI